MSGFAADREPLRRRKIGCALLLALLVSNSQVASAFYRNLRIMPDPPIAGQTYRFLVDYGECDQIFNVSQPVIRFYSAAGGVIRLEVRALDANDFPGFCNFTSGTAVIELPPLPPGRWRLDFYRWDEAQIIDTQLRGSVEFDVVAAPVPVGGGLPIALLALAIGGAGAIGMRRRQRVARR